MKKVMITGACGFIGGHLTERLLADGAIVYGLGTSSVRLERFTKHKNFIPVIADFSMYDKLPDIIDERNFDFCVHAAWSVSNGGSYTNNYNDFRLQIDNIKAACCFCEACVKLGVKRLVLCASNHKYMVANDFDRPINYYGLAKSTASDYCCAISRRSGAECAVAMLANTYGVGDASKKTVNTFIKKLMANEDLHLIDGNLPNDWVYIDDTVNGILAVAEHARPYMDYYVGHRHITSFKEKLTAMRDILGSSSQLRFGEYHDNTYVDYDRIDLNALYNDTNFECQTDFKESILKTAEWVKSLNWE